MTTDVVLNVAALTDVGLRREITEDAMLAQSPVFLVADGMGGHDAGDKSSAAVVEAFAPLAGHPVSMEEIGAALARANERVSAISAQHARGAGSTVAAVALVEHESAPHWLVFNV
ncbi:MAG: serine/threonine-protein phosphatase, partial [Actinomycetota bacterium]|nr:serine/threonine-protein phosphatase [Actinomycetota bacterium]